MKKKAKKKIQKTKSQFRKRRDIFVYEISLRVNSKDIEFFDFMAEASREGRL